MSVIIIIREKAVAQIFTHIAKFLSKGLFLTLAICFVFFATDLFSQVDTVDYEKPRLTLSKNCGVYEYRVTEKQSYQIDSTTYQKDAGIRAKPYLIPSSTNNFSQIKLYQNFKDSEINHDFSFTLEVIDKFQDAQAVFYVMDLSDNSNPNIITERINYVADKLIFNNSLDTKFGKVRLDEELSLKFDLKNIDKTKTTQIKSIYMARGEEFSVTKGQNFGTIKPQEVRQIEIKFSPDTEISSLMPSNKDTLVIETDCLTFHYPISGEGVIPKIEVSDFDFDLAFVGEEKCNNHLSLLAKDIVIKNTGSSELIISGVALEKVAVSFRYTYADIEFPITLQSGEQFVLDNFCYTPFGIGEHFNGLVFSNNAYGPDSVAAVRGIGIKEGPYFSKLEFGRVRVMSADTAYIYVRNEGRDIVALKDIIVEGEHNGLRVLTSLAEPAFNKLSPAKIYPASFTGVDITHEVKIPIVFQPDAEFEHEYKLTAVFDKNSNVPEGSVYNYARGYGYLPKMQAAGYVFTPKILTNTQHPDTGRVVIKSVSKSAPLHILKTSFYTDDPTMIHDFDIVGSLPQDTILHYGDSLVIRMTFRPMSAGQRRAFINVLNDAYSGNNPENNADSSFVVIGNAYDKILSGKTIDFGEVFKCNSKTEQLLLTNKSDSIVTHITGYEHISGEDVFDLQLNVSPDSPLTISPGESFALPVTYTPYFSTHGITESIYLIKADNDTVFIRFIGANFREPLALSIDTIYHISPGDVNVGLPIFLEYDRIKSLDIDNVEMTLSYNPRYLRYNGYVDKGDIISKWSVSAKEKVIKANHATLTIKCMGDLSIFDDGMLIKPQFKVLFADSAETSVYVEDVKLGKANECLEINTYSGYLTFSACGSNISQIFISQQDYSLSPPTPNPVTSQTLEFAAGIGLEGHTKIELIDSHGRTIALINDSALSSGNYNFQVELDSIASGIYFLRMQSGNFQTIQKIVIAK